ncbi:MAG: phosphate acyltransferase PlsX [Bacteroidetes bacterium CG2_30_32_10]|nr:MAG: phosphate acyltransferase PlsX [Bacteroidetes bacterium CG2_30_32_10]
MKIGIDVMGGDYAPKATLEGAILAHKELSPEDRLVLIGDSNIIKNFLIDSGNNTNQFDIVQATDVIEMHEQPTRAFAQKQESSIVNGFKLLKENKIDSFASAGNSGAMLVGSMYSANPIQGILRPCITSILPKEDGKVGILLDVGTNPDCKPDNLYQFAIIGSIFAEFVYKIKNPKVGLLNIGEEEDKGNLLYQSAFKLMKDSSDFNFIGNIESRDLFKDKADVAVCDGFTGNIVLKQAETIYRLMLKHGLRDEYFDRWNYENYGGTPVLGVNSNVIIGHGISNNIAIKNMILLSRDIVKANLSKQIKIALEKFAQVKN